MDTKTLSNNINFKINAIIKSSNLAYFFEENITFTDEKKFTRLFDNSIKCFSTRVNILKDYEYSNSWFFIAFEPYKENSIIKISFNFKDLLNLNYLYELNTDKFYSFSNDNFIEISELEILNSLNKKYELAKIDFFNNVISIKSNNNFNLNVEITNEEHFKNAIKLVNLFKY